MKKLLCLIGLTAFASIEAKEYWQCDSLGKLFCAQNQTCCRSITNASGWECFPTIRGVCCSNGINCCPEGTICELTQKTCVKKTLSFLMEPEAAPESLPSTEPMKQMGAIDPAVDFVTGFVKGFHIFEHVGADNTCFTNTQFSTYLVEVLEKLKNVKVDETLPKFLEELIKDFIAHKELIYGEISQCKKLAQEVLVIFQKLSEKVMQADYVQKVTTHTLLHFKRVKEGLDKLQTLAQAHDYQALGFTAGELVEFVFFWDLKTAEN